MKGWSGIEEQARETQERRERNNATRLPEFRVNQNNPGPFYIRFCEQGEDVHSFKVHEYKEPANNGGTPFIRRLTCLSEVGQQCAWCTAGHRQKTRGVFNILQRQRPVFNRDGDGRVIKINGQPQVLGFRDEIVVANVGGPTAEALRKLDGQMKGLMMRDWIVTYSGDTFQSWTIHPVTDDQGNSVQTAITEQDWALMQGKHDLNAYMAPPSQQEAVQLLNRFGQNSGVPQQQSQQAVAPNHFAAPNPAFANTFASAAPVAADFGGPQPGMPQPPQPAQFQQPVGADAPVSQAPPQMTPEQVQQQLAQNLQAAPQPPQQAAQFAPPQPPQPSVQAAQAPQQQWAQPQYGQPLPGQPPAQQAPQPVVQPPQPTVPPQAQSPVAPPVQSFS